MRTEWEGKVFKQWGKVLQELPYKIIKYNLFAPGPNLEDKPENYFEMTYKLNEQGDHILLQIIREDNRPVSTQEEKKEEENPMLID